ncbi:hypothetical protein KJ785_03685 [Patescibacteria group bacterium]|nr:hypothetical protein [Patescibacteria group bacterium]
MNIKRAIIFGIGVWIAAFVIISILMFTPWFKDSQTRAQVTWWILEIPAVLLLAKWYFKMDPPTIKKGFLLGVIGLVVGIILDSVITVPLFVKSYTVFFGNWLMYVGFVWGIVLTTYAGYEFDATYSKPNLTEENK